MRRILLACLVAVFVAPASARASGDDLRQWNAWIKETLRQIGVKGDLPPDVQRRIHDQLGTMKQRGGTVSRQACEELVLEHESSLKQAGKFAKSNRRGNMARRAGKALLGGAGIGIGLVMVAGEAAAGEKVTWSDVGEAMPIVGPVVTTYVVVDEITQKWVKEANDTADGNLRAINQIVALEWRMAGYMANRVTREAKYPWDGEGWRNIAYVSPQALHACVEAMVVALQTRVHARPAATTRDLQQMQDRASAEYQVCIEKTVITRGSTVVQ